MQGCWHKSVCKNANGNQAFTMFDGRKIQWFCDALALSKIDGDFGTLAYPITPAAKNYWAAYSDACSTDAECLKRSGDKLQQCLQMTWQADEAGKYFGTGFACYTEKEGTCA